MSPQERRAFVVSKNLLRAQFPQLDGIPGEHVKVIFDAQKEGVNFVDPESPQPQDIRLIIDAQDLLQKVQEASLSHSTERNAGIFNCVNLEYGQHGMGLVASDHYRLSFARLSEMPFTEQGNVLLSSGFVDRARTFAKSGRYGVMELEVKDSELDVREIVTQRALHFVDQTNESGEFPQWRDWIPVKSNKSEELIFSSKDGLKALRTLDLKGGNPPLVVSFDPNKNLLWLALDSNKISIPATGSLKDLHFGIHPIFLYQLLRDVKAKKFSMEKSTGSPVVFRKSEDPEGFLYIVMPMY